MVVVVASSIRGVVIGSMFGALLDLVDLVDGGGVEVTNLMLLLSGSESGVVRKPDPPPKSKRLSINHTSQNMENTFKRVYCSKIESVEKLRKRKEDFLMCFIENQGHIGIYRYCTTIC